MQKGRAGINYTSGLASQLLGSRAVIKVQIRSCIAYLIPTDNITVFLSRFNLKSNITGTFLIEFSTSC